MARGEGGAGLIADRRRGRPKADLDPDYDGSTPLGAARRELFSCYAAKLGNLTDAYIAANYTCSSRSVASRNGSRLKTREPGVKQRIDYLSQLDDAAFEQAFGAAKTRGGALDQAEEIIPETTPTVSAPSDEAAPDISVGKGELMGVRETLEYVVTHARWLHQKAAELGLPPNTRRRCLAVHGAATHRLLSSLPKLERADALMAEHREGETEAAGAAHMNLHKALADLLQLPACNCETA